MRINKTPFWFIQNVIKFVTFLAALLTVAHACQFQEESDLGAHLAHVCLNFHSEPEAGLPVIMLHGLIDIKETWDGIYENIPLLARRRVCIYDARNHGDSAWNDTFDIDILAEDLGSFMRARKIEKAALVGHSMGGLTAMKFALKNPSKVERIFVEDISPLSIPKDIAAGINAYLRVAVGSLTEIPDDADEETAKKAVTDYFLKVIKEKPSPHLFKKFPFVRRSGVWQWKPNIDVFIKALEDPDSFLGKMEGRFDGKVFFIYGKSSPFKVGDEEVAIRKLFPNAEFFGIEGVDHNLHPQFPGYLSDLIKFLKLKEKQTEL